MATHTKTKLEAVIGLEIHIQLKTASKMFSTAPHLIEGGQPNTAIDPVVLGHPGVLPTINEEAVKKALRLCLALNFNINRISRFDRKHYFYPDLPKGYQITQHYKPLAEDGYLTITLEGEEKRFNIERLHLEEDAAKNIHRDGETYVDYNRAGAPLAEIVTRPDFRTPAEAKKFLQELQLLARYVGASDADMEKGQLRCDANISLRPQGDNNLYAKTEVKNLNSFRSVERALNYEIRRQQEMWLKDHPPKEQATRGWDEKMGETIPQRSKEQANDYRYMPEPDLPALEWSQKSIDEIKQALPELPHQKRLRFKEEYELKYADAEVLTSDPLVADYFEQVMSEVRSWLLSSGQVEGDEDEIWKQGRKKLARLVFAWLATETFKHLKAEVKTIRDLSITPENFAEFVVLVYQSKVNSSAAQQIFEIMYKEGGDPSDIAEDNDLQQVSDEGQIEEIVKKVLQDNPEQVEQFKSGKEALLKYFIGMVMKESKGKGNPQVITDIIKRNI